MRSRLTGKDIAGAVFPQGVSPIVKPVGQTEVNELRALEGRVAAASKWADREAQRTRLTAVRTEYEAALENRKDAMAVAADKRALRDTAKEDFLDVLAATAGALEEAFPRDRSRQDVFFDEVRTSGATDDTTEPDEPAAPTPG